jgi:hypothetical protein
MADEAPGCVGTHRQWATLMLLFWLTGIVAGQISTGSLRGTIADPHGAVVTDAEISVKNVATGVLERTLRTDKNGSYAVEALYPGVYKITITKPGFAPHEQNIELQVGRVIVLDAALKLSFVEENVAVTNTAPIIELQRSELGGVIERKAIESLPLNGRQFGDLASLIVGVLPAPNYVFVKTRFFHISAGGSDGRQSNFAVDGAENTDVLSGGLQQNFTIEGIQEFEVVSNRYAAEQGRTLGAAVNVVTKSGGNTLHGSYFVFHRNQDLNARDPFESRKSAFHRTQQGVTFGGPVRKNQTFFFVAFENTNEEDLGIVNTNGTFPQSEGSFPLPFTARLLTARADHQLNKQQKLSIRYSYENNFSTDGIGGIRSAENGVRNINRGSDLAASYTAIVTPQVLNTLLYHFSSFDSQLLPLISAAEIVRPSLITGGSYNTPYLRNVIRHQIRNDTAIVKPTSWGPHNLKFGADYIHVEINGRLEYDARGRFFFFRDAPLNSTSANLALFAVGNFDLPTYHDNIAGAYVQDDWKLSRTLTLNLGLRWDLSTNENNPGFISPISRQRARGRDFNNLGPRVGFAWDPSGSGTTVIRGGYGIFYALSVATNPVIESLFDSRRVGVGMFRGPIDISNPFPGLTQANINALVFAQPQTLLVTLKNGIRTPYVQQASIGMQKQLARTMTLTLDYVHNLGLKERLGHDVNIDVTGKIGSPNTELAKELGPGVAASLGPVNCIDDSARSTYNALEASIQKHFSRRLYFLASYTLSHAVDMSDDSIGSTAALPFNPDNERGDSNRDQRHRFVLSGSVVLPKGFELASITSFSSARPFDIVTGASLDGSAPTRPTGIARNEGARDTAAVLAAVNTARAAVGLPAITTSSPRSFFFYSTDLRLTKVFHHRDRVKISTIVEAFNVFNHVNFLSNGGAFLSGVSSAQNDVFAPDFGSPRRTAGGVLGSGGPRAAQLALRFEF